MGYVFAAIFFVNHVNAQVKFLHGEKLDWARSQALTTANWNSGSRFWNHISGGLNHLYYPEIHHIVKETCAEFNIKYVNFKNWYEAFKANNRYINKMGKI